MTYIYRWENKNNEPLKQNEQHNDFAFRKRKKQI